MLWQHHSSSDTIIAIVTESQPSIQPVASNLRDKRETTASKRFEWN